MLSEQAKHDEGMRRAKARDYFKAMVLERHEQPGDDFVSDMVFLKHERDGDLDLSYPASEVTNVYIAATSTTAHLLASAMRTLLTHPDQLAAPVSFWGRGALLRGSPAGHGRRRGSSSRRLVPSHVGPVVPGAERAPHLQQFNHRAPVPYFEPARSGSRPTPTSTPTPPQSVG